MSPSFDGSTEEGPPKPLLYEIPTLSQLTEGGRGYGAPYTTFGAVCNGRRVTTVLDGREGPVEPVYCPVYDFPPFLHWRQVSQENDSGRTYGSHRPQTVAAVLFTRLLTRKLLLVKCRHRRHGTRTRWGPQHFQPDLRQ